MVGSARPSRGLRTGLGVLAAIGVLFLVGRLSSVGPEPTAPDAEASAPARPLSSVLEFAEPIGGMVLNHAAMWVGHGTTVEALDPQTLTVNARVQLPAIATAVRPGVARPLRGLAAGARGDTIWASLANPAAGLLRIDTASARVEAVVPVAGVGPAAVSGAGGAAGVWVVCCGGETFLGPSRLVRVDARTNRVVAEVPLPGLPDAVGVGASGVWVRGATGPVWRVDPVTNRVVATVAVPGGLGGIRGSVVVGRDAVWVSDPASATVLRIDPGSNRIAARFRAAGSPLAVAADGTLLATSGQRVLGIGRGPVRSAQVDGLNGDYASAVVAAADVIWVAESGALFRVDRRALR